MVESFNQDVSNSLSRGFKWTAAKCVRKTLQACKTNRHYIILSVCLVVASKLIY